MRRALKRAAGWLTVGALSLVTPSLVIADAQPGVLPASIGQNDATTPLAEARFTEIQVELAWLADAMTCPYQLNARVSGSALHVRGFVPDEQARTRALHLAVRNCRLSVVDGLKVQAMPAVNTVSRTGAALKQAAEQHLRDCMGDSARNCILSADDDGKLTIEGPVRSYEDRLAGSLRLRQIEGCRSVVNRMHVQPVTRDGDSWTAVTRDGKLAIRVLLPEVKAANVAEEKKDLSLVVPQAELTLVQNTNEPPQAVVGTASDPLAVPAVPKSWSQEPQEKTQPVVPPAPIVKSAAKPKRESSDFATGNPSSPKKDPQYLDGLTVSNVSSRTVEVPQTIETPVLAPVQQQAKKPVAAPTPAVAKQEIPVIATEKAPAPTPQAVAVAPTSSSGVTEKRPPHVGYAAPAPPLGGWPSAYVGLPPAQAWTSNVQGEAGLPSPRSTQALPPVSMHPSTTETSKIATASLTPEKSAAPLSPQEQLKLKIDTSLKDLAWEVKLMQLPNNKMKVRVKVATPQQEQAVLRKIKEVPEVDGNELRLEILVRRAEDRHALTQRLAASS